jgi:hypothetical protein
MNAQGITAMEPVKPVALRYRGLALEPGGLPVTRGAATVQILDAPTLSPAPGTDFLVTLWLRCDHAPTAAQGYAVVIGKYSETQAQTSQWLLGLDANLYPFMKTSTTSSPVRSTQPIAPGVWVLVSAEWASNGTVRLFVNTNLCASGSLPRAAQSSLPLTVGDTYPVDGSHALLGNVDEVRIYKRAATIPFLTGVVRSAPDNDGDGIMDGNDPDDNNDGIPDAWAAQYFGDRLAGGPLEDSDGDGMNNAAEYIAGTDPTRLDSQFLIWDIAYARKDAVVTVDCDGMEGRTYTVWFATNLSARPVRWAMAGTPRICITTTNLLINVPANVSNAYYRLSVRMSP